MIRKLKKLPKAPKKTASIEAKVGYLKKVADVKKENKKILAEKKKGEILDKKISQVRNSKI